jgi:hypothetical protein
MIVAWCLGAYDNGASFYENAPEEVFCPTCGGVIDFKWVPKRLGNVAHRNDLSFTYDGRMLASPRFASFCEGEFPGELEFIEIAAGTGPVFLPIPLKQVQYNCNKNIYLLQGELCDMCCEPQGRWRPEPIFLKGVKDPIEHGFYQTDVMFGDPSQRHPLLIVGLRVRERLLAEAFKGLIFDAVDHAWKPPSKGSARKGPS